MERVEEIAQSMIKRYSRLEVAEDMAYQHAIDNPVDSERRAFWLSVRFLILSEIKKRKAIKHG